MNVLEMDLPEVLLVEPDVFGDDRGFFMETFNAERYRESGLPSQFVQDNLSYSARGVLRGLHFQNPDQQGKLVYVLQGEVFDVAVDIRRGSPRFGQWAGAMLSAANKRQLWIPEGFAHGFLVTSDAALFAYKCTARYNREAEAGILYDDPEIGIRWPTDQPTLSEKDRELPRLSEISHERLPAYR